MVEQNQPIYDYLIEKLQESDSNTYVKTLQDKDKLINEMSEVIKELTEIVGVKYNPICIN